MSWGGYIHDRSSYDRKDPVNLLFRQNATLSNVNTHFAHHLGWYATDGSTMLFIEHSAYTPQDNQRASETSWSGFPRYHIRFKEGLHYDTGGYGYYTIAAVHQDKLALSCPGHRGTNFNSLRDNVAMYFQSGGHAMAWNGYWQGNTLGSVNCDSSVSYGDGYLHVIWI